MVAAGGSRLLVGVIVVVDVSASEIPALTVNAGLYRTKFSGLPGLLAAVHPFLVVQAVVAIH